jgi:membrane peptidoglycan carboxypeptidase
VSNPDYAGQYWRPPAAGSGYWPGQDDRVAGDRGARPDRGDRPRSGRPDLRLESSRGSAGRGRHGGRKGEVTGLGRGAANGAGRGTADAADPGLAGGQPWQVGQQAGLRVGRDRQGRAARRDRAAGVSAAPGQYGGRTAAGRGGQDDYEGPDGYDGPGRRYAPVGYSGPAGYGGGPAGYSAPGGRTAAGLRERAIDRTGIRQRLADRRGGDGYGGGGGSGGGYDGGRRPRAKGSWWRRWTWRKALAVAAATCAVVVVIAVVGIAIAYAQTPVPNEVSEAALQQSSVVYFSNGKSQVGTFSTGTNRQMLQPNQIPTVLKEAVIAAEDRHFYTEGGVSPTGILRAAYQDLSGGQFQGGSTITQQFARNYYSNIGTNQTLSRKIKEIFVAIKLSHKESKGWILTQYLNTIYLGDNAYGVGAAAQTYFGKPASKLNIAQSAMLAAMINQPGFFNPTPHTPGYAPLVARWKYVLANMVKDGAITQQQLTKAKAKFPKIVKGLRNSGWTGYRGYIMQAVETELETRYHYSSRQIFTGGLKIVTTFSQPMMRALYQVVTQKKREMAAGGRALPRYAHIGAVLQQPRTGAILAMYGGPNYGLSGRRCQRIDCQYNMALQSRNQVGSSFKPYVLATAVTQGMNVRTSVLNGYAPLWIPPDSTQAERMTFSSTTRPANAVGWYNLPDPSENFGPITVANAAAVSSNSAFTDLAHRVGTKNVVDMAAAFGVNPKLSGLNNEVGGVGMALGQASLTVAEQANTFSTFAAGGVDTTQHVISKITSPNGPVALKIMKNPVLEPGQAADIDYALSFDDKPGGTAYPNATMSDGRPIIAKTGTTDNAQSAFFVGSIPQYTLAVGIFTQNQSDHTTQTLNDLGGLSQGGYGGTWPALIWHSFAEREFAQLPIKQFRVPPFTGSKWVQVVPVPKQHHHHHPMPTPVTTPSPGCKFFGKKRCPSPAPTTPAPTLPPSPGPSPSPTCTTPGNCKPGG